MTDIRDWLDELGLGRFADAFEAEEISLEYLPELTDADLKELGLPMGPRRAVLKAVNGLFSEPNAETNERPVHTEQARIAEAERRQLTVMFCDLVGSTALSENLDPEDLRSVMADYRQAAGDVIAGYDGHVAQYLGDGLMVYFGWPRAHEDDAERSVRAGLDILDAIKKVDAPQPLQVRIGIATGPVVVGEGSEHDAQANELAVGETPNLAARLQGLAAADEIVIGPGTRQLTRGAFEYVDLGPQTLKGILDPVAAWRVVAESEAEDRFEAQAGGQLTQLIGRNSEIALLIDRWRQACEGEGQVVLLEGEPGIGKSRIMRELADHLGDHAYTRLRYQCSPYCTNTAFYPIIEHLERAAEFARDDDAEQKLNKLETLLGQDNSVAPLFAAILSLPLDRYPLLNLSPQRQKDETIAGLVAQVTALAQRQPVLLMFEDAHWCDPTTLETLTAIIGAIEALPAMLVITHRPEFDNRWSAFGHVTAQSLARLGKRQGVEMVSRVAGGKPLPEVVCDQIVAKTDGVPLFVEELTKSVLEAGILTDAGNRYELSGPLPELAIPSTIQDSLMARLDRLGSAKEVAQIGACFGREFPYRLLSAVYANDEAILRDALVQLEASELIHRRGMAPDSTYAFKHALVQETAYASLLKPRRRQFHLLISQVIQDQHPMVGDSEPEELARHFQEAGLIEKAVESWTRAGRLAASRYANLEALAHFSSALKVIDQYSDEESSAAAELEVRLAMGSSLIATEGLFSENVGQTYRRARDLSARIGLPRQRFAALFGMWIYHVNQPNISIAGELADELLDLSGLEHDTDIEMQAHHARWTTDVMSGDLRSAVSHTRSGQALYDEEKHREHKFVYGGHDPGACSMAMGGWALWQLGYADQSLQSIGRAIELAKRLNHPFSLALTYLFAAFLHRFRYEDNRVIAAAQKCMRISEEHNLSLLSVVKPIVDWGGTVAGDVETGIAAMRDGLALVEGIGSEAFRPSLLQYLADAHFRAGQPKRAIEQIDKALELTADGGMHAWDEELLRLKGDYRLAAGDNVTDAEELFQRSLNAARLRDAKGWELRAATSLARLWQSEGKATEAYELLAPVYDWFTEGFDTADLRNAKALLKTLE